KSYARTSVVFNKIEDSLRAQVMRKNLQWPPAGMYVRSFKYDRQLEVWLLDPGAEQFTLFKTYRVCMQSGAMGPKRMEGDYQVPEGFYYINEFNHNSMYHLSLGLNYPNASDRILSDSLRPGSNIFIHGNCVSTGCIPIMDAPMEELYALAAHVRSRGEQEFIPVHVFPVRYSDKQSAAYLAQAMEGNAYLEEFNSWLKDAFQYFEERRKVPVVLVNKMGEYIVNGY